MKSISDKLQETIKAEEVKNSKDKSLQEFEQLLEQMEKLGSIKKPEYSLPLVDTLGKTYYSAINKHLSI